MPHAKSTIDNLERAFFDPVKAISSKIDFSLYFDKLRNGELHVKMIDVIKTRMFTPTTV